MCHVNCQSLLPHFSEFADYFLSGEYAVIALSETWLKPHIPDVLVALPGYRLFRLDREGRRGGGVGLYVRDGIGADVLASSPGLYCGQPEHLIVKVTSKGSRPLLLCVVYRPPKVGHLSKFIEVFERLYPSFQHAVLLGDLNIDLNVSSHDSSFLRSFSVHNNLHILSFSSTHHTISSHTWIDHCLVSDPSLVVGHGQVPVPFLSNHDLLYITLDFLACRPPPRLITFRDYAHLDVESFLDTLSSLDWSRCLDSPDIDDRVEIFNSHLFTTLDTFAPVKRICVRRRPAPWMCDSIRAIMRRRDAVRRVLLRHPSPSVLARFRMLRNEAKAALAAARNAYLSSRLVSCGSPRQLWSELRSMGLGRSRAAFSGSVCSPERLSEFFASVWSAPVPSGLTISTLPSSFSLPHSPRFVFSSPSSIDIAAPVPNVSPLSDPRSFYFLHILPGTLLTALRHSSSNSAGPDGLNRRLIQLCSPVIFPLILDLFNFSFHSSSFPSVWKSSHVLPIPKSKNPSSPSDFRPISLLCYLSKVLERIALEQISMHLDRFSLLDPLQTGFRKNNSTQTALLKLVDDVRLAIDRRMVTILVLFDFSKAFDTVQHDRLLSKLPAFLFSGQTVDWFRSYLSGRFQRVIGPDGAFSSWVPVTSGVPQGSVLGSLLFSLYINDLGSIFSYCKYILYADDLQLYLHCYPHELDSALERVRVDIRALELWAQSNGLRLNAGKTRAMLLGSSRFVNGIPSARVRLDLDGSSIEVVNRVTNLGLILNSTLNWSDHIGSIAGRVSGTLWVLKHHRSSLSRPLRVRLVESLIFPIIDYCSVVLTDLTVLQRVRLRRILNACVRYVFDLRRDDHVSDFYASLGWLSTDNRRSYLCGTLLFSVIHSGLPLYLSSCFTPHPRPLSSLRSAASSLDLALPLCRTSAFQHSFRYSASVFWNSLPVPIREAVSRAQFKSMLFSYLRERVPD